MTPDNHSGFWHQRYTLRGGAARAAPGARGSGPGAGAEGTAEHTPVFLESLQGTILTTGAPSMPLIPQIYTDQGCNVRKQLDCWPVQQACLRYQGCMRVASLQ